MKRSLSFLLLLSFFLIFQSCCSLNLPMVGDLKCAGKATRVSLDRFIIRLKIPSIGDTQLTDPQILEMMKIVFQQQDIALKRCECGDPNLMMIILGEPVESKGELLTSVAGLRGGKMTADPLLVYKLKKPVYNKIPKLPDSGGPTNPDISEFISTQPNDMVLAVLDSGLDLNRFAGEKFLFENPAGIGCIEGNEPSSGYNFIDNNTTIQDNEDKSHGTFVTKKITEQLNSAGVSYQILPLKISKDRKVSYWDLLCAMSFAKQIDELPNVDIKIINASLGFRLNRNKLLDELLGTISGTQMSILKYYIDNFSNSTLVVTAAGNRGNNVDNDNDFAYYPSGFVSANLVAVGGLKEGNIGMHSSSNYGPISIDIAAPYVHTLMMDKVVGGTSIGTAQISASFAKLQFQNPTLSLAELKELYFANANHLQSLENVIKGGCYEQ